MRAYNNQFDLMILCGHAIHSDTLLDLCEHAMQLDTPLGLCGHAMQLDTPLDQCEHAVQSATKRAFGDQASRPREQHTAGYRGVQFS